MAFCRLVFPLLVLSVVNALECPMILWGDLPDTSFKAGPLERVDTLECSDFLNQELAGAPLTVVFIEETLSPEDLSHKSLDGKTSYPYLQSNVPNAIYLPAVEDPYTALKEVAGEPKLIVLTDNGLSEDLPEEISQSDNFIFIYLKDAREGESRAEFLQRHDKFIQETVSHLEKINEKVIAIYTARYPSWIPVESHSRRVRRAVRANEFSVNGLRLNAEAITIKSWNETTPLATLANSNSDFNETEVNAKLVFENETSITLHFNRKGGYWFFDSVILSIGSVTEELKPAGEEVYAIEGFSYRCAQNVKFTSGNQSRDYTINFQNIKVQPYFKDTNITDAFGESFDCVGFFTAPIWSGLFVVFILLAITFYGIMMMLDIRTMDRFDDPKGKTITINAGE